MKIWLEIPDDSDFSVNNIPFGIFSLSDGIKKIGSRIGDHVIDLIACHELGIFDELDLKKDIFLSEFLNDFIALGKKRTSLVRELIIKELINEQSILRNNEKWSIPIEQVSMHMPVFVRDYTDFYSSKEHATNVGSMFRDPENALLPNWLHLPVGYHGRASSIIPSGIDIHRPKGQLKPESGNPVFGPCKLLDFELEMAFIVGKSTDLGQSISTSQAMDYIFGMVLFNDWSARDIQKWEYVPLGPFLGKSFASSISPWVVTMDALDEYRIPGQPRETPILDYLKCYENLNFDINLFVDLEVQGALTTLTRSNSKYLYWNIAQQLAHHTVNGCNVNIGDMMASGTISGPQKDQFGSMLELSWKGTQPITLTNGEMRKFLQDGDTVIMRGFAQRGKRRVGFGEVRSKVLPALD